MRPRLTFVVRRRRVLLIDGSLLFGTLVAVSYLTHMTYVILSLPFTPIFSLLPLWTPVDSSGLLCSTVSTF